MNCWEFSEVLAVGELLAALQDTEQLLNSLDGPAVRMQRCDVRATCMIDIEVDVQMREATHLRALKISSRVIGIRKGYSRRSIYVWESGRFLIPRCIITRNGQSPITLLILSRQSYRRAFQYY